MFKTIRHIFTRPQPPEERAAHKRFEFGCGNRCACELDGNDQVVVDGLLISCACATDEADHD
jgi:hypothetical protein